MTDRLSDEEFEALSPAAQRRYTNRRTRDRRNKFKADLEQISIGGRCNALEFACAHGLEFDFLYGMLLRHTPGAWDSFSVLRAFQRERGTVEQIATAMRKAAEGLRSMAVLRFPYAEPDEDSIQEGDDVSRAARIDAQGLTNDPFENVGAPSASWEGIVAMLELMPWFYKAEENSAQWHSPYRVPSDLIEVFHNYSIDERTRALGMQEHTEKRVDEKIQRLRKQRGLNWSRRVVPYPIDLRRIARIFDDFAEQTENIAKQLRPSANRPQSIAERAFREEFAEYAKNRSGKYLDEIGSALFSLTFPLDLPMNASSYTRLRQREANEKKYKDSAGSRGATKAPRNR